MHRSLLLLPILALLVSAQKMPIPNERILSHEVDSKASELRLFWKDDQGNNFEHLGNLQRWLDAQGKELVFGMNAGMYMEDLRPLGLYIESGTTYQKLNNRKEGYGNFYMQPNGIFYLTQERTAHVCQRSEFTSSDAIAYATQSGPMLVINGAMHPAFNKGSSNLNIRNGVGILPNGNVLFAMSKGPINFFDFATFFVDSGCKNALYLDGFVSKTYLPVKNWKQLNGKLGVLIGEVKDK